VTQLQPDPVPNDGPSVHDLVIAALEGCKKADAALEDHDEARWDAIISLLRERKQTGIEWYGTTLQAGNGRDWLRDLREELADAACYAMQGIVESGLDITGAGDWHPVVAAYDEIIMALFELEGMSDGR